MEVRVDGNNQAILIRQQQSETAHDFLDAMVETILAGMVFTDASLTITRINREMARILSCSGDELIGNPLSRILDLDRVFGLAATMDLAMLPQAVLIGQSETTLLAKDGRRIPVLFSSSLVPNKEKVFAGIVFVALDLSDRKLLESQLLQSQKLEAIGQLAAGIAHEINTPIQYVGNNIAFFEEEFPKLLKQLELLQRCISESFQARTSTASLVEMELHAIDADMDYLLKEIPIAIAQSMEGVERVAEIVRSLKDFSHPGNGDPVPTDINTCIESTVVVARNEWKYVADLETVLAPNLPMINCFPSDIKQVLLNMIVNAAHAIDEKIGDDSCEKGRIVIRTSVIDEWLLIDVVDTGTGIPSDILERIFDPFFTTKDVGKGTGQGLAISRASIVDRHSGKLEVITELGKGTTFRIYLPLETSD